MNTETTQHTPGEWKTGGLMTNVEVWLELLEALEELIAEHDTAPQGHEGPWFGRNDTGGIAQARAAIAKAKGK